jgi:hypothetical protein
MRQSRELDNVLEECLERLLNEGESLEQCLQSFPAYQEELEPLLEMALATRQASDIQPRPEFREKARYQFYSALQEAESKKGRSFSSWNWWPRWATVPVAIVLSLVVVGGGLVAASGGSIPGEPLYSVKLVAEQMQMAFTPSALGKAELYAKLADRRVAEIVHLAGENQPEQIAHTAQRLDTYLGKMAGLTSTQAVTAGLAMAPEAEESLMAEAEGADEEAPAEVEETLPTERAKDFEGEPVTTDRWSTLKATVMGYAVSHPASLRAALETVSPSTRSALLQAITISETGYEKALESWD